MTSPGTCLRLDAEWVSGAPEAGRCVKFRYPCDGLGPVALRRSHGVDSVGSAGGVGEGAVLAGGVMTDRMGADHFAFERDLDLVVDDGDLDLLARGTRYPTR